MTLELLSSFQQATPFQPFDLFLADGRSIRVGNSEFLSIAPDSRSIEVFDPQQAVEYIDLALVVSVRFEALRP